MNHLSTDTAPGVSINEPKRMEALAEIGNIAIALHKAEIAMEVALVDVEAAKHLYTGGLGSIEPEHHNYADMVAFIAPQSAALGEAAMLVREIKQALETAIRRAQA